MNSSYSGTIGPAASRTSVINSLPSGTSDLISDESLYWIRYSLGFIVQFIVLPVAMTTTIITIIVFAKIGIRDGVSVAFFALTTAQFGYLFFYIINRIIFAFEYTFTLKSYLKIDFGSLGHIVSYYSAMFKDVANGIIVFSAVQKCCCVAIPFHFRNVFTYSRSVFLVTVIYLCALLYYLPVFARQWLDPYFDVLTNKTMMVYMHTPVTSIHLSISRIINGFITPVLSQTLVIMSLIVLTVKLKQASRFRKSGASVARRQETNIPQQQTKYFQDTDKQKQASAQQLNMVAPKDKTLLNRKELKVIQAVYATTIIFVASNIGEIPLKFTGCLVASFQGIPGQIHFNTYVVVHVIQSLLAHIALTSHMFIYVKFNTKYRTQLFNLFRSVECEHEN